jgi:hypothetical protein
MLHRGVDEAFDSKVFGEAHRHRIGVVKSEAPTGGAVSVLWTGRKTSERVAVRFLRLAS